MNKISEHISLEEATKSLTAIRFGITNQPTPEILNNMVLVAIKCFEPLRKWYKKPIKVNSFYRCTLLNEKVGGSKTSQHVKGQAIDMDAGSKVENKKLFDWCKDNLEFDQLINEYDYSWVHISYSKDKNRKQVLTVK
jgi:hypothetical protein